MAPSKRTGRRQGPVAGAASSAKRKPARLVAGLSAGFGVLLLAGCGLQSATSFVPQVRPGTIQAEGLPEDARITYMGNPTGIPDKEEQWRAGHDADLENGLTWGGPASLNNTYSFAVRSEAVPELGNISKMSQIGDLPAAERALCGEAEFNSRPDGPDPILGAYDIPRGPAEGIPDDNIGVYGAGAVYTAANDGDCNLGEVFTTDGRIDALDLTVLSEVMPND